jgi:nucleotide-binding universal stress UspA family protein
MEARMGPSFTSTVVVGVDGSESSLDALRWAARQARLTGASLEVVTAWTFPDVATPFGIVPDMSGESDPEGDARVRLDEAVGDVLGEDPEIALRTSVVLGTAAQALLDASRDADLLVVGSRGLGAFTGMLLGSVSEHCVRHAKGPVVVVHKG